MRELFAASIKDKNTQNSKQKRRLTKKIVPRKMIIDSDTILTDDIESFSSDEMIIIEQTGKTESINESHEEIQISDSEDENKNFSWSEKTTILSSNKIPTNRLIQATSFESIEWIASPSTNNSNHIFCIDLTNSDDENEKQSPKNASSERLVRQKSSLNTITEKLQSPIRKTQSDYSESRGGKENQNPNISIPERSLKRKSSLSTITEKLQSPLKEAKVNHAKTFKPQPSPLSSAQAKQILRPLSEKNLFPTSTPTLSISMEEIEENENLLSQIKERNYTSCFSHIANNPMTNLYLETNGKISLVNRNPIVGSKQYAPEGSVKLTYLCKNTQGNYFAFMVKDLSENGFNKTTLNPLIKWHEDKFKKNAQNSDKKPQCIYIFKINTDPLPKDDKGCLFEIGKVLLTKNINFPCNFMFYYGNTLSQVYTPDIAKKVYQKSLGVGISSFLVKKSDISVYSSQYEKILENVISFGDNNLLYQTINDKNNPQSNKEIKETFPPDQFSVTHDYYINIFKNLNSLRDNLCFCEQNDETNELISEVKSFIVEIQETLNQLAYIRQEYVGNQIKERELRNQWKTIKNDPSFKKYLPNNSEQWLESHIFTVLTRMKDAEKEAPPKLAKEKYYKTLGSALTNDLNQYHTLTNNNRITICV